MDDNTNKKASYPLGCMVVKVHIEPEKLTFRTLMRRIKYQFDRLTGPPPKDAIFLEDLGNAYSAQSADPDFRNDVKDWDVVVGDGLFDKEYTYNVFWSEPDQEYVATCAEFPSLSWLEETEEAALAGLKQLIEDLESDQRKML